MGGSSGVRLGGMVPSSEVLALGRGDGDVLPYVRLTPAAREQMRRIPSVRNAVSVASVYAQTLAIIIAAIWIGRNMP